MKSDLPLGDLKKEKNVEKFYKKNELSNRIRFFFEFEPPYETRTSVF